MLLKLLVVLALAISFTKGKDHCIENPIAETNESDIFKEKETFDGDITGNITESDQALEDIDLPEETHNDLTAPSENVVSDDSSPLSSIDIAAPDNDTSLLSTEHVASNESESLQNVKQAQQKVHEVINQTLTSIKNIIEDAEEKWKEWVKNYECSNSDNLVQCVTSSKLSKSPHSWRAETSQVEIPITIQSSVESLSVKIENSLAEGLRKWSEIMLKANNKKQVKSSEGKL